jgi:hypothetical protein
VRQREEVQEVPRGRGVNGKSSHLVIWLSGH